MNPIPQVSLISERLDHVNFFAKKCVVNIVIEVFDVDGRCPSFDNSPLSLRASATSTAENFQQQFGAREVCRASCHKAAAAASLL